MTRCGLDILRMILEPMMAVWIEANLPFNTEASNQAGKAR